MAERNEARENCCSVCNQECGTAHKCSKCKSFVHVNLMNNSFEPQITSWTIGKKADQETISR